MLVIINICFLIVCLSHLVALPCYLSWKQRTMGQVLFHLPTSKSHKVLLKLVILLWAGFMLMQIVFLIKDGWQSAPQFWPVIVVLMFSLLCMYSVNRFEIREAGIVSKGNFVKWEKLNAFEWKKEADYALGLGKEAYVLGVTRSGDKFPWWLEWDKFRADQRENANKLLSQYLPKTRYESSSSIGMMGTTVTGNANGL